MLLEKGVISTNQNTWMLFTIITSMAVLHAPSMLIGIAGRDAWLAVIGGWILDVLLAVVYGYMGIRFPGENFVQYSVTILGKYLGRVIGLTFPLFFLLVCTIQLYGLCRLIDIVFLPHTPFAVLLSSAYLVAVYGARKGIEVLGRVMEILGPIYFLAGFIITLLVLPAVQIDLLKPQFGRGVTPFLTGTPFILTFYGVCIIMAMFIPVCNRPANGFLAKFWAVTMGAVSTGAIASTSIGLFGYAAAKKMYSASLEVVRAISIGRFLERIELFWMLIAIGAGIMAAAVLIWAFSLGLAQIVGLRTYRPLVYPAGLLSFILAVTSFGNQVQHTNFINYTFPVVGFVVEAGLELLLFFCALLLHKKGKSF